MQATVCIGLIGAAVRALAELDLAPEEVLARLDDIVSRFTAGQGNQWSPSLVERLVGATYLYAVYDPIARRCVMASAGHPPPAVAAPDGSVHVPELPSNGPLGMGEPVFGAARGPNRRRRHSLPRSTTARSVGPGEP
ncbi:PP2C family protein-serine/threonine phosphatase [Streptomyces mirabilis]|uniref:PP2C family protein-serine/threonine phosphatase n=1 Tax=Streptomyces mirabilis TaxID=68239 RepID=UPI0036541E7A